MLGVDELQQLGAQLDAGAGDAADAVTREMLESNVDSTDWKLEVERILPQLRATVRTESKVTCDDLQQIFVKPQLSLSGHHHYQPTPTLCPTIST